MAPGSFNRRVPARDYNYCSNEWQTPRVRLDPNRSRPPVSRSGTGGPAPSPNCSRVISTIRRLLSLTSPPDKRRPHKAAEKEDADLPLFKLCDFGVWKGVELGRGYSGVVHSGIGVKLSEDEDDIREVHPMALKVSMQRAMSLSHEYLGAPGREFETLKYLHSNNVPVPRPIGFCMNCDDKGYGRTILIMDMVEGQTLREWINTQSGYVQQHQPSGRTLHPVASIDSAIERIDVALSLIEALEKLHPVGVFVDLKPRNIMVSRDTSSSLQAESSSGCPAESRHHHHYGADIDQLNQQQQQQQRCHDNTPRISGDAVIAGSEKQKQLAAAMQYRHSPSTSLLYHNTRWKVTLVDIGGIVLRRDIDSGPDKENPVELVDGRAAAAATTAGMEDGARQQECIFKRHHLDDDGDGRRSKLKVDPSSVIPPSSQYNSQHSCHQSLKTADCDVQKVTGTMVDAKNHHHHHHHHHHQKKKKMKKKINGPTLGGHSAMLSSPDNLRHSTALCSSLSSSSSRSSSSSSSISSLHSLTATCSNCHEHQDSVQLHNNSINILPQKTAPVDCPHKVENLVLLKNLTTDSFPSLLQSNSCMRNDVSAIGRSTGRGGIDGKTHPSVLRQEISTQDNNMSNNITLQQSSYQVPPDNNCCCCCFCTTGYSSNIVPNCHTTAANMQQAFFSPSFTRSRPRHNIAVTSRNDEMVTSVNNREKMKALPETTNISDDDEGCAIGTHMYYPDMRFIPNKHRHLLETTCSYLSPELALIIVESDRQKDRLRNHFHPSVIEQVAYYDAKALSKLSTHYPAINNVLLPYDTSHHCVPPISPHGHVTKQPRSSDMLPFIDHPTNTMARSRLLGWGPLPGRCIDFSRREARHCHEVQSPELKPFPVPGGLALSSSPFPRVKLSERLYDDNTMMMTMMTMTPQELVTEELLKTSALMYRYETILTHLATHKILLCQQQNVQRDAQQRPHHCSSTPLRQENDSNIPGQLYHCCSISPTVDSISSSFNKSGNEDASRCCQEKSHMKKHNRSRADEEALQKTLIAGDWSVLLGQSSSVFSIGLILVELFGGLRTGITALCNIPVVVNWFSKSIAYSLVTEDIQAKGFPLYASRDDYGTAAPGRVNISFMDPYVAGSLSAPEHQIMTDKNDIAIQPVEERAKLLLSEISEASQRKVDMEFRMALEWEMKQIPILVSPIVAKAMFDLDILRQTITDTSRMTRNSITIGARSWGVQETKSGIIQHDNNHINNNYKVACHHPLHYYQQLVNSNLLVCQTSSAVACHKETEGQSGVSISVDKAGSGAGTTSCRYSKSTNHRRRTGSSTTAASHSTHSCSSACKNSGGIKWNQNHHPWRTTVSQQIKETVAEDNTSHSSSSCSGSQTHHHGTYGNANHNVAGHSSHMEQQQHYNNHESQKVVVLTSFSDLYKQHCYPREGWLAAPGSATTSAMTMIEIVNLESTPCALHYRIAIGKLVKEVLDRCLRWNPTRRPSYFVLKRVLQGLKLIFMALKDGRYLVHAKPLDGASQAATATALTTVTRLGYIQVTDASSGRMLICTNTSRSTSGFLFPMEGEAAPTLELFVLNERAAAVEV